MTEVPDIVGNSAAAVASQLMQEGPSSCGRALHHTLCGPAGSGYFAQSLGGSKAGKASGILDKAVVVHSDIT